MSGLILKYAIEGLLARAAEEAAASASGIARAWGCGTPAQSLLAD